jgi:hypothetical protein
MNLEKREKRKMKIHKLTYSDTAKYVYTFVYRICDGPGKIGNPKGLVTFNSRKVTCKKCRKLNKKEN